MDSISAYLKEHGLRLLHGDTDRFQAAGAFLAQKRVRQGRLQEFEAELAELTRQAEEQGENRVQIIGDWRLLRRIDRGGIGEVWLGERDAAEVRSHYPTIAAIKILRADKAHDRVFLQRFLQGAKRIQAVTHPVITSILSGPSFSNGRHYYAMEYVDAPDLASWIAKRQLPYAETGAILEWTDPSSGDALWHIISTVAGGLSALHDKELIHGDVKPRNILVDRRGRVKLCDFDLVQFEPECDSRDDPIGTLRFLAPEVRDGERSTALSDQFSFAMTVVSILSELGSSLHQTDLDPVELLRPLACTITLKSCLERALSPDPRHRYETIEGFMEGLGPEVLIVTDRGHARG